MFTSLLCMVMCLSPAISLFVWVCFCSLYCFFCHSAVFRLIHALWLVHVWMKHYWCEYWRWTGLQLRRVSTCAVFRLAKTQLATHARIWTHVWTQCNWMSDQRKDSSSLAKTWSSTRSSSDADKIAKLEAKLKEARRTIEEQKGKLERAKEGDVELQQWLDAAKGKAWYSAATSRVGATANGGDHQKWRARTVAGGRSAWDVQGGEEYIGGEDCRAGGCVCALKAMTLTTSCSTCILPISASTTTALSTTTPTPLHHLQQSLLRPVGHPLAWAHRQWLQHSQQQVSPRQGQVPPSRTALQQ